jgi:hypothetical protein
MDGMAIPFLACMVHVAMYWHLPPRVLPSIQAVEGGFVGSISHNTDGSDDLGVMQVNTLWLQPLSRVTGLPVAEVRRLLIFDGCFNIGAAGMIMDFYRIKAHGDLNQAVGDYHSHTPALHDDYLARVLAAARRLFGHAGGG